MDLLVSSALGVLLGGVKWYVDIVFVLAFDFFFGLDFLVLIGFDIGIVTALFESNLMRLMLGDALLFLADRYC